MIDELTYLQTAAAIHATAQAWNPERPLPLYLRQGAQTQLIRTERAAFLLVRPHDDVTLPEAKRLYNQISRYTDQPVVLSLPHLNARQRKSLVVQGIPFLSTGQQLFLPFMGTASTEWGKAKLERPVGAKLSAGAQRAAIWGVEHDAAYTLSDLRDATDMNECAASRAVSELAERGLVQRSKQGRTVIVTPLSRHELLTSYMRLLATPVVRTIHVQRCSKTENLPLAGESALAAHGSLNPPRIEQRAVAKSTLPELASYEVCEGELPDSKTLEVQVWRYPPLFINYNDIDNISLALSLLMYHDERVKEEIDRIFKEEYPWHEAR